MALAVILRRAEPAKPPIGSLSPAPSHVVLVWSHLGTLRVRSSANKFEVTDQTDVQSAHHR